MKQETKELIDWIKKQINIAKTNNIDPAWNGNHKKYNSDYDKAMSFLNSLPEIEAKLCRGGYIQDKNGVPCCEGDNVKFFFNNKEMKGVLVWSESGFFYITAGIIDYDIIALGEFEKV
jgi:hypothetical protein